MDKRIILKTCLTITVILTVSATDTITEGKIIYVDDAIGANDDSSWADSYRFLQNAPADAQSGICGFEVIQRAQSL